ncbi:MAG TPA: acylase, partial [Candidatus Hydrogenedentes bacterium]|nr:acylase [Candidatus Hydrogenedentota bacterium]
MFPKRLITPLFALMAAAALASCVPGYVVPIEDPEALIAAAKDYDVEILRDTWGVPHIYGKRDADAAFGLAYAHCEDDFTTIQEALLTGRGALAAHGSPLGLPLDYMVRLLRIWKTVDAKYETDLSPETRAVCEGYAAGVNYYAALHPEEVTADVFPASGKDIVAGAAFKAPNFFGLGPRFLELLYPIRKKDISKRLLASIYDPFKTHGHEMGSNTLAVGPGRSEDGATRLAINAHQPWYGQLSWYEAHVHSEEGWDCAGALFPGAPVILHGHNQYLGWAHTVNSPDLIDTYVLTINPENPDQYRFDGRWYNLEVQEVEIPVLLPGRFRKTVKMRCLWSPHHGPVVRWRHGTYALRYAGMGEVRQMEQWFRMNKARNLDEFQDALRMQAVCSFNVGYADKEGNVYYLYNAKIPVRAEGYDWEQYLPGDTSETVWNEYLPFDALPHVLNPPSGIIQNCNSTPYQTTIGEGNPRAEDFSQTCGIEENMTNRALRALELLGADGSITREEFLEYKFDMKYSKDSVAADLVKQVRAMPKPEDDPLLAKAIRLIGQWNLSTHPNNRSAALAVTTLMPVFLGGKTGEDVEISAERIKKVAYRLKETHGRIDVPWRQVNRLRRGALDVGLGGGPDILHAVYGAGPILGRYHGVAGDSYVMVVEWDRDGNLRADSVHQFGAATTRPSSPHYADQVPLFVNRELKPAWFEEAEVRAHLEWAYRPG